MKVRVTIKRGGDYVVVTSQSHCDSVGPGGRLRTLSAEVAASPAVPERDALAP